MTGAAGLFQCERKSSVLVFHDDVKDASGVDYMLDGNNVQVIFNPKTEKIVQAFFWIDALMDWIEVTDFVLNPDNRRLYDKYLIEIIKTNQEQKEEQKLVKGMDVPL